jgi:hypothetical protein
MKICVEVPQPRDAKVPPSRLLRHANGSYDRRVLAVMVCGIGTAVDLRLDSGYHGGMIPRSAIAVLALLLTTNALLAAGPEITVYKTRTCGCCAKWVDHLKANGFQPTVKEVANTADARKQFGVPEALMSCHNAVVNGYAIEGHVPAADIRKLLGQKPKSATGLAVPGMPLGSPGMEQGDRKQAYSVLLFTKDGKTTAFTRYAGN